jgi:hypothetical protein
MLCKKIIAECFKVQKNYRNTVDGQNVEFLNSKPDGRHQKATTGTTQWKKKKDALKNRQLSKF